MTKEELISLFTPDKVCMFHTTILIGDICTSFKNIYKGRLYTIVSADDVRQFLADHNMPEDKPIVFEDLSMMTSIVRSRLLKFIEEPPAPLIILASSDNISPVILSRCCRIIKTPNSIKCQSYETLTKFVDDRIALYDTIKSSKKIDDPLVEEDIKEYKYPALSSLKQCPQYQYLLHKFNLIYKTSPLIDKHLKLYDFHI